MSSFTTVNASVTNRRPFILDAASFAHIRGLYGDNEKPSFGREIRRGQLEVGQQKEVVLATCTGKHPREAHARAERAVIEICGWSDKYCFWTVKVGNQVNQRFIVISKGVNPYGGVAYRRWLGIGHSPDDEFEQQNYLYSAVEPQKPQPNPTGSVKNENNNTAERAATRGHNHTGSDKPQPYSSRQLISDRSRPTDPASDTERATIRLDKTGAYSAIEILQQDRAYYKSQRPDFVQLTPSKIDTPVLAELTAEDGRGVAKYIKVYPRAWDSASIYWVTTRMGEVRILQKYRGGQGGAHFRLWRGHRLQTDGEVVAKPLGLVSDHPELETRIVDEPNPLTLLDDILPPTLSDTLALRPSNALAPGKRPTRITDLPPPRVFSIENTVSDADADDSAEQSPRQLRDQPDLGPEIDVSRLGVFRQRARQEYGSEKPEFVRERGSTIVEELRSVVDTDDILFMVEPRWWDHG
ncbi:MAG: hypothetical protein Q9183_004631, partial [Haloplaca sp. 2 TL-2023]